MTDHHHAHDATEVAFAVLTISSSRTAETDESGDALVATLEDAGHAVVARDLVSDDRQAISERVTEFVADPNVDAVVTTGGTGLTADDVTTDALAPLFDREIPGFGEEFRSQSVEDVGPHGLLTRATAGIVDGVPVFCLPGSEQAATFGASELVDPIVEHVVGLTETSEQPSSESLTHVDDEGTAQMVDVGDKPDTERRAVARGEIHLQPTTVEAIRESAVEKGDVLATARIGAIRGVKHTWESVPMCHQIPITNVDVDISLQEASVTLTVGVETTGKTGCEMEALEGVTTGLNVVWDMVKAAEKDDDGQYPATRIDNVRVLAKHKQRT
jgi:cyclic pyranopterin phosphate synthase